MKKAFLVLALALISRRTDGAETAGGAEKIGDYLFSMNGMPFTPHFFHLHGEPGKPAPGDVFRIRWMYVPLGEEKEYRLEEVDEEPHRVRWWKDGKWRWLAASTNWNYGEDPKTVLDGLAELSPEELKDLRAVALHSWNDQVAREVALLDGDKVSILFSEDAMVGKGGTLPPFPPGLRYLFIDESSPPIVSDFRAVGELLKLELLDLDRGDLDLRHLESLSNLRMLRTGPATTVRNLESLGRLKALRHLDLGYCDELKSLDPILPCKELRVLLIDKTSVEDLSALGELPRLRRVEADRAPVSKLPTGRIPSLLELSLVETKLSETDLAAFRRSNPGCTVYPQGTEEFRRTLAAVDRMQLRSRSFDPEKDEEKEASVDVTDRSAIEDFLGMITITKVRTWNCGCISDSFIDFFRDGREVDRLVVHHGFSLVSGVLGGEGILEEKSAERVVQWLYDHGAKNPLQEVQRRRAREIAEIRKTARCMEGLPDGVREAFQLDAPRFDEALRKAYPLEDDRITVLLRILGADNGPWNRLAWQEQIADKLLDAFPTTKLGPACEMALLGTDRQARRGAARFFKSFNSLIEEWTPRARGKVHAEIVAVQAESRSSSVRQTALRSVRAWASEMEPAEVDRRLNAALRDPHEQVRRAAILIAGEMEHKAAETILLDTLQGRPTRILPLPEVPESEKEDVDDGFDEPGGKAEAKDLAALALGYLRSELARPIIEASAPRSDFCRVALALHGKPELLLAEDFQSDESDEALQLAAVEAVIREKGRVGLDLVLAAEFWDEELVVRKVRDMLLRNGAPHSGKLQAAESLEHLRAWFDTSGSAYLESLKKPPAPRKG